MIQVSFDSYRQNKEEKEKKMLYDLYSNLSKNMFTNKPYLNQQFLTLY